MSTNRIVIGITGASGAVYAKRLVELLLFAQIELHLVISKAGIQMLYNELGVGPKQIWDHNKYSKITVYRDTDLGSQVASGSFLHDGMVIVPCSTNTLGAIASGVTSNLIHRAALVSIKERRKLILAYRESPISHIDILNMDKVTLGGGIIAPLSPGFYMLPADLNQLVDSMVARLLDLLGVSHNVDNRWKGSKPSAKL